MAEQFLSRPHPAFINGEPAHFNDLLSLTFAGFAHFTFVQVRNGQVRALDLHLERLITASHQLFGQPLSEDRIVREMKLAIGSSQDIGLLYYVYSDQGEFNHHRPTLQTLVRTLPASSGPTGPLQLKTVEYERLLPDIKHVGEIAKTHFMHSAAQQGFDDAAFIDRQGYLLEASIWNLVFWDGEHIVWPEGPMLRGTMMATVQRQLTRRGISQKTQAIHISDIRHFRAAAVLNSWSAGIAVSKIDEVVFTSSKHFIALLHNAYQQEPWEVLPSKT
ncbi:aminotransferase class IV [Thaumasiovibrio subtropicus]|uniref:aminotransferase class IV n=1 Tax=Thaumasiovibrio subtropicus TaxID=1891207 RepID=UPI000B356362|nr:aminotransferase class IV [Thaumasiovibrio subtropicus]